VYTPFEIGSIYRRRDIHDQFGGSRQGGIAPCARFPYIFIFSGQSGQLHGYRDGWDNHKVFSYTGEGQSGDMRFVKGNLALKDHVQNRKRVFLFEGAERSHVKFICELELFDFDFFETHDTAGEKRQAIRFFLKKRGEVLDIEPHDLTFSIAAENDLEYHINIPNTTERKGLVTSRVGQGAYRKSLLHKWEYKCAVTGINQPKILIASHIVPWKDSNDKERLDVNNGIILSPVYDALFDRNFISFENNGKIILSSTLSAVDYKKLGVTGKEFIGKFNSNHGHYLDQHRKFLT
jgi:5-methylcytosine-specific restriction protein A